MFDGPPLSQNKKALLKIIAERALTRGRKLTAEERFENLESGLGYAPGELRKKLGMHASNPAVCAAAPAAPSFIRVVPSKSGGA